MTFHKYHGTGNDFIILDDRAARFDVTARAEIARLCQRHFGIGADGLMLLRARAGYDFEMVYFNADGAPSSMCGNGGRCLVAFARYLGIIQDTAYFLAVDGPHEARIGADDLVHLKMGDAAPPQPVSLPPRPITLSPHQPPTDVFLYTGSPHHVHFLDPDQHPRLAEFDVQGHGRAIRYDQLYDPVGTNVNFVEAPADSTQSGAAWAVRTYERGVEAETYSCGTGVTAVALAASGRGATSPVRLSTPGGELEVAFEALADGGFTNVWLSGPAVRVFEGRI